MLFWRNWKVHQSMTYKKLLNIYLNSIPWHHFTMHHLFSPKIWCENWCFVNTSEKNLITTIRKNSLRRFFFCLIYPQFSKWMNSKLYLNTNGKCSYFIKKNWNLKKSQFSLLYFRIKSIFPALDIKHLCGFMKMSWESTRFPCSSFSQRQFFAGFCSIETSI